MKQHFLISVAVVAAALTAPVFAADVGVSVSIGQPGFYCRLDIGDFPAPQVVYRQPIAVERVPMDRPPVYLRVPPGHAKHWRKHCHEYNACGERVLFVQDGWYNREYVPRYQERHHGKRDDNRDGHGNKHRDNRRDDRN